MISPDMFKEFILPELMEEMNGWMANHFPSDGPGALKHLDMLLKFQSWQVSNGFMGLDSLQQLIGSRY